MIRFIKNYFLRLVSKREGESYEPFTVFMHHCMCCKTKFNKPAEMYVGEFVICKECATNKRRICANE
jgi:hypothetical protein